MPPADPEVFHPNNCLVYGIRRWRLRSRCAISAVSRELLGNEWRPTGIRQKRTPRTAYKQSESRRLSDCLCRRHRRAISPLIALQTKRRRLRQDRRIVAMQRRRGRIGRGRWRPTLMHSARYIKSLGNAVSGTLAKIMFEKERSRWHPLMTGEDWHR